MILDLFWESICRIHEILLNVNSLKAKYIHGQLDPISALLYDERVNVCYARY